MGKIHIENGIISSSADYGLYRGTSQIVNIQDGEFRVLGDLIAENYIVSSSVTSLTLSSISGSTIFGDTPADDTHQFTGSVSITGSGGLSVTDGNILSHGQYAIDIDGDHTGGPRITMGDYDSTPNNFMSFGAYSSINNLDTVGRDFRIFDSGGFTAFYFDVSENKVGIGTTGPNTLLEVGGTSAIRSTYTGTSSAGVGGTLQLVQDDGAAIESGHRLGVIVFGASEDASNTIHFGAGISAFATQLHSATQNGTKLAFEVTADGATSRTTAMTIFDDGNVGIGISLADGRLHVSNGLAGSVTAHANADELIVENSTHGGISILTPDSTNSNIYFGSPSDNKGAEIVYGKNDGIFLVGTSRPGHIIKFRSDDQTDAMVIDDSQNIGIGTSSPTQKVDIRGGNLIISASGGTGVIFKGTGDGSNKNALYFKNASNTEKFRIIHDPSANGTDDLQFKANANSVTVMTMLQSGNVGINEANPDSLLHIYRNDTSVTPMLKIEQDGTGDAALLFNLSATQNWQMGISNGDSDKFKISTTQDLDNTTVFTIDTSGNVGIGTTSPSHLLHVDAGSGNAGVLIQSTSNTGAAELDLRSGDQSWSLSHQTDGDLVIYDRTRSAEVVSFKSGSGNVGIGTDSPSELLTISNSSDTNKTKLAIVGGTKGFTIGKTFQGQSYGHIRPISSGQVMALRLMPNTTDQDTFLEIFGHDYETETTNFARGMLVLKQSDGNAFQIISDANGSESVGPIEFIIENGSEPAVVIDASGRMGIGTTSPGYPGLHISNSTPYLTLQDSDGTNQKIEILHSGGGTFFTGRNGGAYGSFQFRGYNGSTFATALTLDSSQNAIFAGSKISGSATSTGSFGVLGIGGGSTPGTNNIHVYEGGAKNARISIEANNTSYNPSLNLRNNNADGQIELDYQSSNRGDMNFYLDNDIGGALGAIMSLRKAGHVEFIGVNQKISGSSTSTGSFGKMVLGGALETNAQPGAKTLVVQDGMTIYNTGTGRLNFSDGAGSGDESYKGVIKYNHSTNILTFAANAVDRVSLNPSGVLQTLHVSGSSTSTGSFASLIVADNVQGNLEVKGGGITLDNNQSINIDNTSGTKKAILSLDSSNIVNIGDNSNSAVISLKAGNVGIGTSNPSAKIHIDEVSNASYYMKLGSSQTEDAFFWYNGSSGDNGYFGGKDQSSGNVNFQIHSDASFNTYFASQGGNVGIGDSSPDSKLTISDATNDNLRIGTRGGNMNIHSVTDAGASSPLAFEGSEFQFITGNIGIGVSPTTILNIKSAQPVLKLEDTTAYNSSPRNRIEFRNIFNADTVQHPAGYIDLFSSNSTAGNYETHMAFTTRTASSGLVEAMRIDSSQNAIFAGSKISGSATSTGSFGQINTAHGWDDGWHGNDEYIALTPQDFLLHDNAGTREYGPYTSDSGGSVSLAEVLSLNFFATKMIPKGFTAISVHVYASATLTTTVSEGDITNATVTSKGSGNTNATIDITDVDGDGTNYIIIKVDPTSTNDDIYGAKINIQRT